MRMFGNMSVDNNNLTIAGAKATALAACFGTPLYVMDEMLIRENCRSYYEAFKCNEGNNTVAYAGKAFLTLAMCDILKEEGLSLDVVSGGELYTAWKANFPMDRIYFHGNNKTMDEMQLGVSLNIGHFIVDNLHELEMLNEIAAAQGKTQKILMRITPGIEAHTHEYIKTGQLDSKFGFAAIGDNIISAVKAALSLPNVELAGLHCHIGSQIFDIEPYEDAARIMVSILKNIQNETGVVLRNLDLGGGFGIYYRDGDEPRTAEEYCRAILNAARNACAEFDFQMPRLIIEPGRSIVGNAGTTLYTIGSIKDVPNIRKYVSVDGGMTDNIRPALYSAQYECMVANKVIHAVNETVTVSGKCCESGDILLSAMEMPQVSSGDVLAVLSTGAYGYSMCSNYNKIPKPAVVMVNAGEARVICKRESYEDMLKNEIR